MRSNFEKAYEPNPYKSPFTEVRFNEEKQIYEPLNQQLDRVARSLNAAWYGYRIRQTEVDELQKQLIEQGQRFNAQNQQIATLKWQLKRLGYTDNGGELMKPPIGDAPKFDLLDELRKRVDAALQLVNEMKGKRYPFSAYADQLEQALKGEQP